MPETKDSEFTWKDYQARNNNELVAILGNFVNRAVVLTHKFYDGKVPSCGVDEDFLLGIMGSYTKVADGLEKFDFRGGLAEAMNLARAGNKYLADSEPWKTIKTDPDHAARVIATALNVAAHLRNVIAPFLPYTSARLTSMLGLETLDSWKDVPVVLLNGGHSIGQAELLFTPFTDEQVEAQVQKLHASAQTVTKAVEPRKPTIAFEDFQKMDIRIATVLEAGRVPKTKKLLKLTVDTGFDTRTIVSGIAEHYSPEEVVGRQVCVLVNLAPRDLKGISSQGMVLMAEDVDGRLVFVRPDVAVQSGSGVA
jgi:methionyl-tRNA synthetase